ncbi:uncharacterized protein LOC110033810 [Phalaenopsis equestris]|uniref:uncharacterized protein LOC110033810 n=1 Tax=Phalaenopsis equestris TaxID=78828 RepID=UPI0009E3291D|nr:uncharacterized protein LOC110033810 [Phalaenopsis equestris]
MEKSFSGNKRSRGNAEESPEAKRLHADLIFGILEDDDIGAGERDPASQELEIVMKSLEEEIGRPAAMGTAGEVGEAREMEIGYLLEASDDELGLPPAGQSSPEEEAETAEGFGRIWGFEEDGVPGWYEGFSDFGGSLVEERFGSAEEGSTAYFDAGLFDLPDFYLRPESLPAI